MLIRLFSFAKAKQRKGEEKRLLPPRACHRSSFEWEVFKMLKFPRNSCSWQQSGLCYQRQSLQLLTWLSAFAASHAGRGIPAAQKTGFIKAFRLGVFDSLLPLGLLFFIDVMGKLFPFRCLFNVFCLILSWSQRNERWKTPMRSWDLCLSSPVLNRGGQIHYIPVAFHALATTPVLAQNR